MKKIILVFVIIFFSCSKEEKPFVPPVVETPKNYTFKRNNESTVQFLKAITHYNMALELTDNLGSNGLDNNLLKLHNIYTNGIGFTDNSLNTSGEKLRDVVASAKSNLSTEYKSSIKIKIDNIIQNFVSEIIPAKNMDASINQAGNIQVKDDESIKRRYFNKKGLEADQSVSKILFGSLFLDQIANNHLSQDNLNLLIVDNNADVIISGHNYTALEHAWDMSYGYVFGLEGETPLKTVKTGYLNSYLKANYKNKNEFNLFFDNVLNAFKKGRQAVVQKNYKVMNQQAKIIREQISKMIAVRTVHYLWKGLGEKEGKQLHALSEVYGFLYALQFAHINGIQQGEEYTNAYIKDFDKGVYNISDDKINELMVKIAKDFDFKTIDVIK